MPETYDVGWHVGVDEALFKKMIEEDEPVVMRNCSFGDCLTKWNLEYLDRKLGQDDVIVHQKIRYSDDNSETHKFHDFARMIRTPNAKYYLKSTSSLARSGQPASIEEDYPAIAKDLVPPAFIPYGKENALYHSSALCIGSKSVKIRTQYNLYDNVLCQIVGTKSIILIPPRDSFSLLREGYESPVDNLTDHDLDDQYPEMQEAELQYCILKPGECLYIPALWWHNIRSENEGSKMATNHTIGFNIFWRNEKLANESFYAPRDIHRNKNPLPYDAAVRDFDKAMQHLNKLPEKYSEFYKEMFSRHIQSKCPFSEYEESHYY